MSRQDGLGLTAQNGGRGARDADRDTLVVRGPGRDGLSRPYSAREAAALLGVSHDTLTRHYESVHGYRLGARVLFPRWAVDRLVADPGAVGEIGEAPTVERVLALLPLLSADDLRKVTRAVLAREVA